MWISLVIRWSKLSSCRNNVLLHDITLKDVYRGVQSFFGLGEVVIHGAKIVGNGTMLQVAVHVPSVSKSIAVVVHAQDVRLDFCRDSSE